MVPESVLVLSRTHLGQILGNLWSWMVCFKEAVGGWGGQESGPSIFFHLNHGSLADYQEELFSSEEREPEFCICFIYSRLHCQDKQCFVSTAKKNAPLEAHIHMAWSRTVPRHPATRRAGRVVCLQQFLLLSTALCVLKSFCGGVGWELVGVQYMVEKEMGKEKEKWIIKSDFHFHFTEEC